MHDALRNIATRKSSKWADLNLIKDNPRCPGGRLNSKIIS